MPKIIHSMVRVLDLDRSLAFYADVLGLRESHRLDFPDFALVYLRNDANDFEIELTLNKGHEEPYTHGTGYGHIGVVVDDAVASHAALVVMGHEPTPVKEFKRGDELLARHGHYR